MFTCKIENSDGAVYVLTGDEPVYQVIKIEGLNPPKAQINTTTIVGLDGAMFNSSKLESRNIVLTIRINGDVETNRQNLYQYFRTKEACTFYYTNQNRDVYIQGYVESVVCDLFSKSELAQISIICPSPYFKSLDEIVSDISNSLALFTFPFSINQGNPIPISSFENSKETNVYNASESQTGVIIEIDIEIPVNTIEIKNIMTGDDLTLEYSFLANDRVIINTNKGQRSITLYRNGVQSNIFAAMVKGSTFFQLSSGDNIFTYLVDDGANDTNVYILFKYYKLYRGV